jgi:alpha-amylase
MNSSHTTDQTRNLVLYFQVHQPKRLKTMRFFDIGGGSNYFDDELNKQLMQRIAKDCYLPANDLLLRVIKKNPSVKIAFSISGVTLEQFEEYAPEVIESFRALASTGSVEFLSETYFHSLACMMPGHEFEMQILKHTEMVDRLFGVRPSVFRNTELIYDNEIGRRISMLGFNGIFTDGISSILNARTPHQLFEHPEEKTFKIFLRNYQLSDDIAFRFAQPGDPLTVEKYLSWMDGIPAHEKLVTLALDYETFGEHQKKETGIFVFLENWLTKIATHKFYKMMTPTEAIRSLKSTETLSVSRPISWADYERDLSAWLGNDMQRDAFDSLLALEKDIRVLEDPTVSKLWRYLQTSDHFYYMSTKGGTDGGVHTYFSPYASPYEAFVNYMNILTDFSLQVNIRKAALAKKRKATSPSRKKIGTALSALAEKARIQFSETMVE